MQALPALWPDAGPDAPVVLTAAEIADWHVTCTVYPWTTTRAQSLVQTVWWASRAVGARGVGVVPRDLDLLFSTTRGAPERWGQGAAALLAKCPEIKAVAANRQYDNRPVRLEVVNPEAWPRWTVEARSQLVRWQVAAALRLDTGYDAALATEYLVVALRSAGIRQRAIPRQSASSPRWMRWAQTFAHLLGHTGLTRSQWRDFVDLLLSESASVDAINAGKDVADLIVAAAPRLLAAMKTLQRMTRHRAKKRAALMVLDDNADPRRNLPSPRSLA